MSDHGPGGTIPGVPEVTMLTSRAFAEQEAGRFYRELLDAVETFGPDETRHETALRYIRERESASDGETAARKAHPLIRVAEGPADAVSAGALGPRPEQRTQPEGPADRIRPAGGTAPGPAAPRAAAVGTSKPPDTQPPQTRAEPTAPRLSGTASEGSDASHRTRAAAGSVRRSPADVQEPDTWTGVPERPQ